MKFENAASAYSFYKNMKPSVLESRTEAIQSEIRSNAEADMASLAIELEGIESAMSEKRGEQRPAGQGIHPGFTATTSQGGDAQGSTEYRSAFYKQLMGRDLTAEERRVYEQVNSEKRSDAFNTLSNAAAVIPTKTLDQIMVKARDEGGIMGLARGFSMPANIAVPVATPGSTAQWHTEGAKVDTEMVSPTTVTFAAHEILKVISISAATKTLSVDSFESYLTDELTASVMACLSKSMVDGSGAGEATGILTGITWKNATTAQQGQTVNEIEVSDMDDLSFRDLLALIALLKRGYSRGAHFVMSNDTLYNRIYSLHDDNNSPVYQLDLAQPGKGRILGFPVTIDDYMPSDVLLFGDFSRYGYNLPTPGLALDVSRESSFKHGLIDYRALCVADARPIIDEAFVRLVASE